jgi:hypothetical protein
VLGVADGRDQVLLRGLGGDARVHQGRGGHGYGVRGEPERPDPTRQTHGEVRVSAVKRQGPIRRTTSCSICSWLSRPRPRSSPSTLCRNSSPPPAWPRTRGTDRAPCRRRPPGASAGNVGTAPAHAAVEVAGHRPVREPPPEDVLALVLLPRSLHPLTERVEKTAKGCIPGIPRPVDATGALHVPPEAGSGRGDGGSRRRPRSFSSGCRRDA